MKTRKIQQQIKEIDELILMAMNAGYKKDANELAKQKNRLITKLRSK